MRRSECGRRPRNLLVDGRPTRPEVFGGSGWPIVETAVLGEPTFAESYQSLCKTAGPAAPRWVAMSPVDPGGTEPKIWFLIAMPGNLVALELVTAGAHATYFFRVDAPGPVQRRAAREARYRRREGCPRRQRGARRLPLPARADGPARPISCGCRSTCATGWRWRCCRALAWARARFVARIVHRDPASWSAAVADLIRWHATASDEAAEWPGRTAQESQITAAGGDGADAEGGGEDVATAAAAPEPTQGSAHASGSSPGVDNGQWTRAFGHPRLKERTMPTFKHPCPYCGKFIDRAVAACPFCGVVEPFSPKRCQNCRKIVEDPAWVVCPSCGMSLLAPPPAAAGTAARAPARPVGPRPRPTQPAAAQPAGPSRSRPRLLRRSGPRAGATSCSPGPAVGGPVLGLWRALTGRRPLLHHLRDDGGVTRI